MKTVVSYVQLREATDVLNQPSLSRIPCEKFTIQDFPNKRYLMVTSDDPRMEGSYMVIPYENVRAIRFKSVEIPDV